MKITPHHYTALKNAIASLDREQVLAHKALELGNDKEKRFRWDLLFASKQSDIVSNIYKYANDSHLDTALRKIVAELSL